MRGSNRHIALDIGLVAVAFVILVTGAWLAQSGGFALTIAIVLIGFIAVFVPIAVILHEEHELHSNTRRPH